MTFSIVSNVTLLLLFWRHNFLRSVCVQFYESVVTVTAALLGLHELQRCENKPRVCVTLTTQRKHQTRDKTLRTRRFVTRSLRWLFNL